MKIILLSHSKIINSTAEAGSLLKFLRQIYEPPEWQIVYFNAFPEILPFDNYRIFIETCDILVLTEYLGHIGYGQFLQLKFAEVLKKPVLIARRTNSSFNLEEVIGYHLVCRDQGIEYATVQTNDDDSLPECKQVDP